MTDLANNIGNHSIEFDPYGPGSGNVNVADPKHDLIPQSYVDTTNNVAFKDDNNDNYFKYLTNNALIIKNGHLLDKRALAQRETDKETIHPSNYANTNMRSQIDSSVQRNQYTGDGVLYGGTKISNNKEHTKDYFTPAGLSTFNQDPRFATGNVNYGANQGINDTLLTKGSGTYHRAIFNGENQQQISKESQGEQRTNPNRIQQSDFRIDDYLIDGLVKNPYSIYNSSKNDPVPEFYMNSRSKSNYTPYSRGLR